MEFKIGDDIIEEENSDNNNNGKNYGGIIRIVIIVFIALVVGILVFVILNNILNPKVKEEKKEVKEVVTSEKRPLTESNVKTLYQYVTYGTTGTRNDKFVKNDKVTLEDFTNEEKFYYALQLVQVEDFLYTGELDENNHKIYTLSDLVIKKYMERFFGKNIKYTNDIVLNYPFTFSINEQNIGIMKYNSDTLGFDTVFDGISKEEVYLVEPYLGKLVEAYKEADGGYRLVEKLVYTKVQKQDNGKYTVTISKDYGHENVIDTLTDQDKDDLENIKIDNYIKKAATITYDYKLNGNVLYFYSSVIK